MTIARDVLDCPMDPSGDANVSSVREYLVKLLGDLWHLEEGFNSKRPFGNSSWQYEVYEALVREGLLEGEVDEWGDFDVDTDAANQLILSAISELR